MNDQVRGIKNESNEQPASANWPRLRENRHVLEQTLNVSMVQICLGILAIDLLVTLLGGLLS